MTALNNVFQVRASEWPRVLFFGGYVGLAIGAGTILKAINDAIFLGTYSPVMLPYAFIASAVVMTASTMTYSMLTDRVSGPRLRRWTLVSFASVVIACAAIGPWNLPGWTFVQYILLWVVAGLLATLGWQITIAGFDTRQRKRLMPLLGAMATVGAMLGGMVTRALSGRLGVNALLIVAAGIVGLLFLFALRNPSDGAPSTPRNRPTLRQGLGAGFGIIRRNRLMQWMTAVLVLSVMSGTFIEFQFNSALQRTYDTNEIGAFLGGFYFWLNGIMLVLQLFVMGRLLGRYGMAGAMLSRPVALLATAAASIVTANFWAFTSLRFFDILVTAAWYKPGRSLAFAPMPLHRADRVMLTHDGIVDPLARLTASALLIAITPVLSTQQISWVLAAIAAVWLAAATRLKRHYVAELAQSIHRRIFSIHTQLDLPPSAGSEMTRFLDEAMASGDEESILFALDVVRETKAVRLFDPVASLAAHASEGVRIKAIETLASLDPVRALPGLRAAALARQPNTATAHALRIIAEMDANGAIELALELEDHPDPRVRRECIAILLTSADDTSRLRAEAALTRLAAGNPADRADAAYVGERSSNHAARAVVTCLLADEDANVREAAIAACGFHCTRDQLDRLIVLLGDPKFIESIERALAANPDAARDYLLERLAHLPPDELFAGPVARLLALKPNSAAARALVDWLDNPRESIRYHALKALLRCKDAGIALERTAVDTCLELEMRQAFLDIRMTREASDPLARELGVRRRRRIERILMILSFSGDSSAMQNAKMAIVSGDPRLRANALEYLDSTLEAPLSRLIIDLVDDVAPQTVYEKARAILRLPAWNECDSFEITRGDPWLQTAAGDAPQDIDPQVAGIARAVCAAPIFQGIPFKTVYELASQGKTQSFRAGEWLVKEGEIAEHFWLVLEGGVSFHQNGRPLGQARAGATFGETGMLVHGRRTASVRAETDCTGLALEAGVFWNRVVRDAFFSRALLENLSKLVREASERESAQLARARA